MGNTAIDGRSCFCKNWHTDKVRAKSTIGFSAASPLKFDQKPSEVALSAVFSNLEKCRSKVADDVISDVAVNYVGLDVRFVRVKFDDSISNGSRDIEAADFVSDERTNMTEARPMT